VKEQELFDWLKAGHYSDLEKSSNEYDGFDCTSDHYKMFIELKSRLTHYDTLLLERKKFDFLVVTAEVLGYQPWYINSTPLGVWAFALNSVVKDLEWVDKWLPATTEFQNKSKTTKLVTFLPLELGIRLT
jgi:hypothetical protein